MKLDLVNISPLPAGAMLSFDSIGPWKAAVIGRSLHAQSGVFLSPYFCTSQLSEGVPGELTHRSFQWHPHGQLLSCEVYFSVNN